MFEIKEILKSIIPNKLWKWLKQKKRSKSIVKNWSHEKFNKVNMDVYESRMGYRFDIEHPVLFTEKIQWIKSFYYDKRISYITNKVTFKTYVEQVLGSGHTIPMLWHGTSIRRLNKVWDSLPNEFCIKSSLQTEGRMIKFIHNKNSVDKQQLFEEVKTWVLPENSMLNTLDWPFYDSKPEILIEEYKETISDQLFDYKVFCFNGQPYCIYVAQERFVNNLTTMTFYNLNWDKLDVKYGQHEVGDVPKPDHLDLMLQFAKKLSKNFPFVRVDFFDTKAKLYVAELTFNPGGGYTPYYPESFNKTLGNLFLLPPLNK